MERTTSLKEEQLRQCQRKRGLGESCLEGPPTVLLDHAGYPIDIEKNEVRLLVDLDLGIWWVKAK